MPILPLNIIKFTNKAVVSMDFVYKKEGFLIFSMNINLNFDKV